MNAPAKFPWARTPLGVAPLRRPNSVRRTTNIDTHWPEGMGTPMIMQGHGRDIFTPADGGAPTVLAEDRFTITAASTREIIAIETSPERPHARELVGVRAGGASREALGRALGDEKGGPLYQIIDDFAGASLVAGWIWSRWVDNWRERMAQMRDKMDSKIPMFRSMEGICTGFAPGSSALGPDGTPTHARENQVMVGPLANPDDPQSWHELDPQALGKPQARRARRIDVWREDGVTKFEAMFEDSGPTPSGERTAVHQYQVEGTVDEQGNLASFKANPHVLPFQECPGAPANALKMVGQPIEQFRLKVIETLPGVLGCTHLNDVMRALSDVPHLAQHIPD